ncbi:MAG: hypothetical protein LBM93_01190 [Oscillospiraceae bacterium]|jgi:hypothetical protein|nr:hypothetical protein [Oscillospiraceae bacterium]
MQLNFLILIGELRTRPQIVTGEKNFTLRELDFYLNGYYCAKRNFSQLEPIEYEFRQYFEKFILKKFNVTIDKKRVKWETVITENSKNDEDSIKNFLDLFDEFYKMILNKELEKYLDEYDDDDDDENINDL